MCICLCECVGLKLTELQIKKCTDIFKTYKVKQDGKETFSSPPHYSWLNFKNKTVVLSRYTSVKHAGDPN